MERVAVEASDPNVVQRRLSRRSRRLLSRVGPLGWFLLDVSVAGFSAILGFVLTPAFLAGEQHVSALPFAFGFAILIVFLVLSAQFESFVSAFVVMATVPLGLACAIFSLLITGQSRNVHSQIGLDLLIGVMAKNGILIVEFANQLRDSGQDVKEAITNACSIRLRPVMMTMTSTVLGGVPLVMSFGAGAEAREALGWVIVGGLGLATLFTLYLTPVAYLLLARFTVPKAKEEARLLQELEEATPQRA